ncbi:MAG: hypothetical protein J7K90_09280 [Desulfuromusa sp.]|nr:hypothetical protein [Desulfuromusa sp.]
MTKLDDAIKLCTEDAKQGQARGSGKRVRQEGHISMVKYLKKRDTISLLIQNEFSPPPISSGYKAKQI